VKQASAEDLYWFTLEGGLDHLRHGITATYSFNYGGHGRDRSEAFNEQTFRGEADSGVRFVHGWEPGKYGPAYTTEVADRELGTFLAWTEKQAPKTKLLSVMINGMTSFDGTPQQAVLEAALMKHYHVSNQSHYLEQPETQVADREQFKWFTDAGLLTDKMMFGHFIHTDAAILAATGQAHAAMSWNPLSNGRLASGVADIPQYVKAGIRVGMGVDGEASADLADPFENLRTGLYAIRDKYENAGVMSPYEVLRLHTMGSADVLGVADRLGSLEPGKMADFLVIDFDVEVTLALKEIAQAAVAFIEQVFVDAAFFKDGDQMLDAISRDGSAFDFNLNDRPTIGGEAVVDRFGGAVVFSGFELDVGLKAILLLILAQHAIESAIDDVVIDMSAGAQICMAAEFFEGHAGIAGDDDFSYMRSGA
jgi:cytosine/adenosine deaminase-related metal-dependent hydrolase